MIVYQSTKAGFSKDISTNRISDIILDAFRKKGRSGIAPNEINSWKGSLTNMYVVLNDPSIPDDSGISIEYHLPQTNKRIDFIITGQDHHRNDHVIIVELKGWESAEITTKDAIVVTAINRSMREMVHPSYQAWSYASMLQGFNETVYNEKIQLNPCAYLYHYPEDGKISHSFYEPYISKAPLFLIDDLDKLRDFIKQYVKYGDKSDIIYRIDNGKIKPSKSLADSMANMLKGNQEFFMIDDQKVVYETALTLAKQSSDTNKNVLIVEGGPGTGKSVVAVNLLVALTKLGLLSQYITKNAAPRAVYESKLTGTLRKTEISNMFTGSGRYVTSDKNTFDALVVDEAHRLNEKSGLFNNLGENQIKEIIHAAKFSVFFIDEDQKVTLNDIGEKEGIIYWAKKQGAKVHEMELASQFRCNGSDGYLAWLDNILQIQTTANETLTDLGYDFKVFDSPNELRDAIFEKNKTKNKARLVAGYCWDWKSKKYPKAYDIAIDPFDFKMRWNLATDGGLWIISRDSVNEIGCIHTCQGLEVDYIGVVIGNDLVIRDGLVVTDPTKRSKMDASIKGYKSLLSRDPIVAKVRLDRIIKNTYRTLMTRGMKGCYVYFTDKETEEFFKAQIEK